MRSPGGGGRRKLIERLLVKAKSTLPIAPRTTTYMPKSASVSIASPLTFPPGRRTMSEAGNRMRAPSSPISSIAMLRRVTHFNSRAISSISATVIFAISHRPSHRRNPWTGSALICAAQPSDQRRKSDSALPLYVLSRRQGKVQSRSRPWNYSRTPQATATRRSSDHGHFRHKKCDALAGSTRRRCLADLEPATAIQRAFRGTLDGVEGCLSITCRRGETARRRAVRCRQGLLCRPAPEGDARQPRSGLLSPSLHPLQRCDAGDSQASGTGARAHPWHRDRRRLSARRSLRSCRGQQRFTLRHIRNQYRALLLNTCGRPLAQCRDQTGLRDL